MKKIFQNKNAQARFEAEGFVVKPFLNSNKVAELSGFAKSFPVDIKTAFYSTSYHEDLNLKKEYHQKVYELLKGEISEVFENFDVLGSAYLFKQPGNESWMPPHQDWTVVDEKNSVSLTIWIPLQDLNESNGAIKVLPKSHKKFTQLRAPSIPFPYQENFMDLEAKMETLFLKKGEAFIFNHALVHGSSMNNSKETRIALAIGLVPKNEELFMLYRQNGTTSKYAMPKDMFIRYPEVAKEPLIGEKVDEFKTEKFEMTKEEITAEITNTNPQAKRAPLFTDPEINAQFFKDGFVKLPALNEAEITELRAYYEALGIKDEMGYGFHVGMDQTNKEMVAQMVDKIGGIALPKVQPYLVDVQLFTASFVIKEPNPKGVVPPHQDWSFVEDEETHTSVTCWIPLQDVNMQNGCIGVIKGSNNFFDHIRPSPSPQAPSPLFEHMFTIFPYLQLIEMMAGEALFFNNKTIHASPPNTTDKVRLGIGLGLTQKDAEVRHYYLKPSTKDRLLKYKADQAFYKKYDNPQLGKLYEAGKVIEDYEVLAEVPYNMQTFTKEEWKEKLKEQNEFNIPLVETMADLFNYNMDGTPKEEPQQEPQPVVEEMVEEPTTNSNQNEQKGGFFSRILKKIFD